MTALIPIPALIIMVLQRRKGELRPFLTWQMAMAGLWFFVASIVGIPTEWIFAGACLGFAGGLSFSKSMARTALARWILVPIFVAIGLQFLLMVPVGFPENMVLAGDSLTFSRSGEKSTIPRSGLIINALDGRFFPWEIRHSKTWTSFSGRKVGPDLFGSQLYWGPTGLIRGDHLGQRLANWAGSKPDFLTFNR